MITKVGSIIEDKELEDMERRALSRGMGLVFERAEKKYPIIPFTMIFKDSNIYKEFFTNHTIFSQSPGYVLELWMEELEEKHINIHAIIQENNTPQYDGDVAYWIGYTLATWYQKYRFDMNTLTQGQVEWLYYGYDTLHTQTMRFVYEEYLIEMLGHDRDTTIHREDL